MFRFITRASVVGLFVHWAVGETCDANVCATTSRSLSAHSLLQSQGTLAEKTKKKMRRRRRKASKIIALKKRDVQASKIIAKKKVGESDTDMLGNQKQKDNTLGKFAYVTMWFNPRAPRLIQVETNSSAQVDDVMKLVKSLGASKPKYPLVVLTNDIVLKSWLDLQGSWISHLDIEDKDLVHNDCRWTSTAHSVSHLQKVQIFSLVSYEKLLWLDADIQVHENVDHLFQYPVSPTSIYGQRNRIGKQTLDTLCSGVLLFVPSLETYHALLKPLKDLQECPNGDQALIIFAFGQHGWSMELFAYDIVDFCGFTERVQLGHCLG